MDEKQFEQFGKEATDAIIGLGEAFKLLASIIEPISMQFKFQFDRQSLLVIDSILGKRGIYRKNGERIK